MPKQSRRREKELLEAMVVKRALEELQTPSIKLKAGGQVGWPDRLFFLPSGKILLQEYKWGEHKPDARQVYIHQLLGMFGHVVQVHNSKDEALSAIKHAKEMASSSLPEKGRKVPARKRGGGTIP
jgi:hypothetical protein